MTKMTIGFDVSQALYGTGVSDYTIEMAKRLKVTLFGYSLRRQTELKKLFPNAKIFPFPPTAMHYLWNKFHLLPVENLIGTIDIYHSSDWAQALSKAKKVTTVHDLAPFLYPSETSSQIVSVHTARMRWVVAECDKIICVSQSTANDLVKLFPSTKNRTIVIPEALPSRFLLEPNTHNPEPYILAIGSRQPRKNITRLVSAFLNYRPAEKLIIIGENSSIINHKSIIFTGYVSDQDLVNYLASASCFVYPSLYEGFGLPILGTFHHQIPVAVSDIPVFHETASNAAVYFDPYDEKSIASGISDAINNKTKLVKLGTEQLKKFSWQKAADETIKVYKSLC
ncbi:MAG TPA: glycosyltransferase family 1 protein [Patescibacteria group bacterium]|nr:glycosyltransferase family 1 protein [Patescibacteria group bacterium]